MLSYHLYCLCKLCCLIICVGYHLCLIIYVVLSYVLSYHLCCLIIYVVLSYVLSYQLCCLYHLLYIVCIIFIVYIICVVCIIYIFCIIYTCCILGWVNFSEFKITVCGTVVAKCQKNTKMTIFFIFILFYYFAKILNHFSTPLHGKKNKLHFRKCLKTVLN